MNRIIVEAACEHGWFEPHTWACEARTCKGPTLNPRELFEFSQEAIEAAAERLEDLDPKVMTRRGIVTEILAAALGAERNL